MCWFYSLLESLVHNTSRESTWSIFKVNGFGVYVDFGFELRLDMDFFGSCCVPCCCIRPAVVFISGVMLACIWREFASNVR